jgi:hypothetical protein
MSLSIHARRPRALGGKLLLAAVVCAAQPALPSRGDPAPAITGLARDLAARLAPLHLEAVAVVELTDLEDHPTELGRYVAGELAAALGDASPGLRVIDRSHLAPLLQEKRLAGTGLTTPEEIRAAGPLAGVQALVTGRLTPFADSVRLQAVVLRVGSGRQLATAQADLPRTRTIEELEARALRVVASDEPAGVELDLDGPPRQTVESHGFRFALRGCARFRKTVHCGLTVTSQQEGNLYLLGDSRVLTSDNAQVDSSRIGLGAWLATGSLSRVGAHVLEGFPVAATVSFDGVPATAGTLRLLEVHAYGFRIQFADVPIER